MVILLLLLVIFSAIAAYVTMVVALMLLLALGTTAATAGLIILYGLTSTLGGLALSAVSRRLNGPRWRWPLATLWLALATAAGLGFAWASVTI